MNESGGLVGSLLKGTHVLGSILIGLGALAAITPALSGGAVVVLAGVLLGVAGAVRAVFGWRAWSAGKGPLGLLLGGLALVCGLVVVLNPVSTLGAVSSIVAVYLLVDGGSELLFGARLDHDEGRAWMWGDALLSIALGVSMWAEWPLSGVRALGVIVGIKLLSAGVVLRRVEDRLERVGAGVATVRERLRGKEPL
jgi:uncharacterized membrane protein HdeD (DUF308 family)